MTIFSPFDSLLSLQRSLEEVMQRDFFGVGTASRGTFPPVSVFRDERQFVVKIEAPGHTKEEFQIEASEALLRISGERKRPNALSESSMHRAERYYGKFDRSVKLPMPVDSLATKAVYQDGVLSIYLPIADKARPTKVTITGQ